MEIFYELETGYIVNNEAQAYLTAATEKGKIGKIKITQNIPSEELVLYSVNTNSKKIVKNVGSLKEREHMMYLDGVKQIRNIMLTKTDVLMGQSDRLTDAEKQALTQFRQELRNFNVDLVLDDEHHSSAQVTLVLPEIPEAVKKYNLFY